MGAIYLISILVYQGQKQILVVIKIILLFTVFSKLKFYLCMFWSYQMIWKSSFFVGQAVFPSTPLAKGSLSQRVILPYITL